MGSPLPTQITEPRSVEAEQFSQQRTVETPGLIRIVGPKVFFTAFPLLMRIPEQLLVREAPFLEQPTEEPIGLARRVGQRVFFGAFPLRTQMMEWPSVAMERLCEQQMGEIRG